MTALSIPAFAISERDCTEGHSVPGGYTFFKKTSGNTDVEFDAFKDAASIASLFIGDFGLVVLVTAELAESIYLLNPGDEIRGDYVTYIYYDKWSSGFWEHTIFYATDHDGTQVYLGCNLNWYWVSNRSI